MAIAKPYILDPNRAFFIKPYIPFTFNCLQSVFALFMYGHVGFYGNSLMKKIKNQFFKSCRITIHNHTSLHKPSIAEISL